MSDTVTVITLTRKRSELLRRAILSVQCQDYTGLLQHLILIDECPQTKLLLEMLTLPKNVDWHYLPRETGERSGPKRSAWLRNYGVQVSNTQWISFLDDDNEFEYNHISSLVACAEETCCLAVHSQRKLYNADGTPYLEQRMPWGHGEEIGYQMYKNLQAQGIIQPGSNIMHDKFMPTHCHTDGTPVVDTGEWLLARELLKQYPLSTDYSLEDWNNSVYEDVKLQLCLSKLAIPVASTEQPTVKYYLGGYSNTPGRDRVPGIWAPFD